MVEVARILQSVAAQIRGARKIVDTLYLHMLNLS